MSAPAKPPAAAVIAYGRYCQRVTALRPPQKPQPFPEWLREWELVQRIEALEPPAPPAPKPYESRNYDMSAVGDFKRDSRKHKRSGMGD